MSVTLAQSAQVAPQVADKRAELRGWGLLAAGSLAVAGLLALLVGASRMPRVEEFFPALWNYFPTALVTHVLFSFIVWFLAMQGLFAALATRGERLRGLGIAGLVLSVAGSALLLLPAMVGEAPPSLNNYVPILTHPASYLGLVLLALGVLLPVLRLAANPIDWSDPFQVGTLASGLCLLPAFLCFGLAWTMLPEGLDYSTFNERLFWGGGHVLQFLNTGLTLAAWGWLTKAATGRDALPAPIMRAVMAGLLVFAFAAPAIYPLFPILSLEHRDAFTQMLKFGLVLGPSVMALGIFAAIARPKQDIDWKSPAALALIASIAVFGLGGILGYFLGVGDTRTPAHYHGVIGGVNLAFYGIVIAALLPALGLAPKGRGRAVRLLFWFYGIGQSLMVAGMFSAGLAGVPRKTAGAEQGLDSLLKTVSMGVSGMGQLVAIIGGVIFVWITLRCLLRRRDNG